VRSLFLETAGLNRDRITVEAVYVYYTCGTTDSQRLRICRQSLEVSVVKASNLFYMVVLKNINFEACLII
jgi:hypothetical protein